MIVGSEIRAIDEPDMQSISDRISRIQQHFKLNDVQLGKKAGVSKQAVGQWKNRGAKPDKDALINMRLELGVSDIWVLEGKGPMLIEVDDDFIRSIRAASHGLDEDRKRQVLDFARYLSGQDPEQTE